MALETQPTDNKHFVIKRSKINTGKIFVEFYLPKYKFLLDTLENGKFPTCQLKTICRRIFDGPFGSNRKVDMYQSSGIPYVRVKQVQHEGIDATDLVYISPEKHQDIIRSRVIPGDVLLTIAGSRLGKAAVFPNIFKEGNITGHIAGIEVAENISPHYLTLYINSRFGEAQIARLSHRSTRKELNLKEVGQIIVPVPPRSLQDKIVQVMQKAYGDRQKKLEEAVNLLQGINELLLDELNIDLSLIHQESKFLVSSLELSKKWRVENHDIRGLLTAIENSHYPIVKIGELSSFVTKKHISNQEFYYIEIGSVDIDSGLIQEDQLVKYMSGTAPNNAQRQVKQGDILISTRRPTRGAIVVVPKSLNDSVCTLFFSIVRLREDIAVIPEYIVAFLRTQVGRLQFQKLITETTYPVVSDSDVAELLLPLPPLEVQQKIVAQVQARISDSKLLRSQAEAVVAVAKARVERMILGEETVE